MSRLVILHTIATSYYKNIVFNEMYKQYKKFHVIHQANTDKIQEWKIYLSEIKYPFDVLFEKKTLDEINKIKLFLAVWKKLNKINPEIVYSDGYYRFGNIAAILWTKLNRKRLIIESSTTIYDNPRYKFKEYLKSLLLKTADFYMTYGKLSKEYLLSLGISECKIKIKPNVTNIKLFNCDKKYNKKIFKDKKIFLYVGRFAQEKNILFLLDAFNIAKKNTSDKIWKLILIGNGPEKKLIFDLIRKNEIKDLSIIGFLDKEKLPYYYCQSDVFILPSISETWGIVVNEAMACENAIILSNHCGCSKDLIDKNGYIFDCSKKEELVKILEKYMQNKIDINFQKIKSKEIIKKFTPEYAALQIIEVVKKLEVSSKLN